VQNCEGSWAWQLGADSTVVMIDHGPFQECYLNHSGSNDQAEAEIKLWTNGYYYSGDPDSYIREVRAAGFDSLRFVRGGSCLLYMSSGDTVRTAMPTSDYGYIEGGYAQSCSCPLGVVYFGLIQIKEGMEYTGCMKIRRDYGEGGRRFKVLGIQFSSCPDVDTVIEE